MLLSVLIPNYNGETVLPQFFPSVLKSLESFHGSYEVIVVDDGSKDNSVEFLNQYVNKIKLHIHEKNKGFSGACNTAASLAQGQILFFLNTDVELAPGFFDHFAIYFKDDDVFAVTVHGIQYRTKQNLDGIKWGQWDRGQLRVTKNLYLEDLACEKKRWPSFGVQGAYFFVNADKFKQLGGFDERLNPYIFEETDLCYRAMKRGWKIYYEPKCQAHHDHSSTLKSVASQKKIQSISFRNRLIFTWKNIQDTHLLAAHFFYLALKLLSLSPVIWKAFVDALSILPSILRSRQIEKRSAKIKDTALVIHMRAYYQQEPSFSSTLFPVFVTVLIFLVQEFIGNFFNATTIDNTIKSYAYTFCLFFFFCGFILELQKLLTRQLRWLLSYLFSFFLSLLFLTQFSILQTDHQLTNFLDLTRFNNSIQYVINGHGFLFISFAFIFFQLWSPDRDALFIIKKQKAILRALFFISALLLLKCF